MPFKLLIGPGSIPTSGEETDACDVPEIVEAIRQCDVELKRILEYTGAVSDERALKILDLLERDDNEEGRNIRIAELIGVGGKNISTKINNITRRAREIRRSRAG